MSKDALLVCIQKQSCTAEFLCENPGVRKDVLNPIKSMHHFVKPFLAQNADFAPSLLMHIAQKQLMSILLSGDCGEIHWQQPEALFSLLGLGLSFCIVLFVRMASACKTLFFWRAFVAF